MNKFKSIILLLGLLTMSVNANQITRDQAQISSVISGYAVMADQGAFEYLGRLFAPELVVDYSSLFGGEAQKVQREALMQQWASFLPGFDTTYHQLSNLKIEIGGDNATATVDFIASHFLDEDGFWQISGQYHFALNRSNDNWVINSVKLVAGEETGSRDVLAEAPKRAEANLKQRNSLKIRL